MGRSNNFGLVAKAAGKLQQLQDSCYSCNRSASAYSSCMVAEVKEAGHQQPREEAEMGMVKA